MASTSRTSSASAVQGFSILQPTLGSHLSFLPAVGSKELDTLIDAYLPGPASPQEKRAAVALEFFEYSARTGENFKYFAVPAMPATAANSPVGVTPSPVMSELTYASSSQPSTPATPATKTSRSAKRPETTDFSHLPGMKIITLDGQDVTNHVSRGCKTKEQRDHAHLMRILKACDACKKKKIRCDPSHKKRSASQVDSAKSESVKPAKKSKKTTVSAATPRSQVTAFTPAPPDVDYQPDLSTSLEDFTTGMAEWDQYFTFNEPMDATLPQDLYTAVPQDFNFFFEPETQFSPATSGSSAVSPAQPLTPTGSGVLAAQTDFTFDDSSFATFAPTDTQEAMLPYLASGAHGSNYVDFNLFSPSASFIDDEEPKKLKAGRKRKTTASLAAGLSESLSSSGAFHQQQQQQQQGFDLYSSASLISTGVQLPFHNNNSGHGIARGVSAEASLRGLPSPSGIRSPTVSELVEARNNAQLQAHNLRSLSRVASASMAQEGVSPSASSEVLARTTGTQAELRLTTPMLVSPTVCKVYPLVILLDLILTLEKALQVLDVQQPSPQLETASILPPRPSPSPATAILSNSPGRQGQCVPAGGLTSSSADPSRTSAILGPKIPSIHPLPTVATDIQHSAPVILAGLVRSDTSLQQQPTVDCTSVNATRTCTSRSTGPPGNVNSQGALTARSILSSLAQLLPESMAESPLAAAVRSISTPVRQLLTGSTTTTTPLSVVLLAQLAVFGLVSLLLIVAVTTPHLQQQLQLQYPVFASIIPLSTMMISLFLTLSSPGQQSFLGKHTALDSVRSLLSGSPPSAAAPSRPFTTTPRVMACF